MSSTSSDQVHTIGATLVRRLRALRDHETRRAGPLVARAFHLLLGLIFLDAFVSLGSQLRVLIGSRGLLPAAPLLEALRERSDITWLNFPTLFWIDASDTTLLAGCWLGGALAIGLTVEDVESWPERIGAVTVTEINAAARDVLGQAASVTALLLPADKG